MEDYLNSSARRVNLKYSDSPAIRGNLAIHEGKRWMAKRSNHFRPGVQMQQQGFGRRDLCLALFVFALAAGIRVEYVLTANTDRLAPHPPFQVQDPETAISLVRSGSPATDRDGLVESIAQTNRLASRAPLAKDVEETAHISPGYPYLVGYMSRWIDDSATTSEAIIWTQCGLSSLTAVLYLLFARLVFGSLWIGVLAGVLAAVHPFWIVNVAEIQDGTLASFLLASCLFLGTAAAQRGGPMASLLFGASLAGLALVRAALLPFGFVACLWFLLRCRHLPRGWVCALLVVLGFGNGLAPWTVRNFQVFGEVEPITDSLFVHLYEGNNELSTGGPQSDVRMLETLPDDRKNVLAAEPNQAARYRMLAHDVWNQVQNHPATTIENRLRSLFCFICGREWFSSSQLALQSGPSDIDVPLFLPATLMVLLVFGLLGWRWSYGRAQEANLASLAVIWIPLPYVLTHAERLSGPRLPLDGVLICYAAFALVQMLNWVRSWFSWERTALEP
jgi:4-amino-4-deoxy-L-arabinose transferase-like glycosyltransferase